MSTNLTAKEKWEQLKQMFADALKNPPVEQPVAAPEPTKPVEYNTKDGKVLSIDTLAVGGVVMIDGAAAPDGEYILEDNTNVQVSGGKIVELSSPTEDLIPEEMKCLPAKMAAFESKFAAFEEQHNALKQDFAASQAKNEKQSQVINGLLELFGSFVQQPVAEPAVKPEIFKSSKVESNWFKALETLKK